MKRSARVVAGASMVWLGVAAWAVATDSRLGEAAALLVSMLLLATMWWLLRSTERERRRWQHTLDAMNAGIVLYDADDRLVLTNAEFRRLYQLEDQQTTRGMPFEELLRTRVLRGLVPEAVGQEERWIAERLTQHRSDAGRTFLREMADSHWRRITEQRLPDGSRLGFSIDITELVENQRALEATRHEAERAHQLLNDAIEAMPAAVEVYDRGDRLVLFNRRLPQLYPHMSGKALLGETFETLVRTALAQEQVPEALGQEDLWLAERLNSRGRSTEPRLQRAANGAWHHIYETPMPRGGLVAVRLDATEMVHQREALRAAHERVANDHALLDDAIESLPDGFALFDSDDRLLLCNQRFRNLYRDSAPAILVGASFESMVRHGLDRGQYPQAGATAGHREAWLAERLRRHREPDGVPVLQELPGNRWLRIDERRTPGGGVAGVRTDVSEMVRTRQDLEATAAALQQANTQLEELSATDALTGLANRRRFDARLAEEVQRSHRHGTALALLMIDIDHFKLYNDLHGHPQGDSALQAVAAVMARQARRPGELVARHGGEEFALLLPHANAATALTVAERCHAAMGTLALPHGASPTASHVTLSIGAAMLKTSQREDATTLVRRADAALYAAKAGGRARCVMDQELDE
jgi:diguanylate cyclase (GGDEF)-like protein